MSRPAQRSVRRRLVRSPVAQTGGRPSRSQQAPERRPAGLGTMSDALIALQASAGNAAVQRLLDLAVQRTAAGEGELFEVPVLPLTGRGEPVTVRVEGGCDNLTLHGQTDATYNGGRWHIAHQRVRTSTACGECPPEARCLHLTGTLVSDYGAAVTIAMPGVPGGLTDCEAATVRRFLRTVLLPHEREHRRRFQTYNGQTRIPLDLTGCGRDDLTSQVTTIHTDEDTARQEAANTLSDAVDPFDEPIDCSACER